MLTHLWFVILVVLQIHLWIVILVVLQIHLRFDNLVILLNHFISVTHHLILCFHVATVAHCVISVSRDVLVIGWGHLRGVTDLWNRTDLLQLFILLQGFKNRLLFFRIALWNDANIIILRSWCSLQIFDHNTLTILLLLQLQSFSQHRYFILVLNLYSRLNNINRMSNLSSRWIPINLLIYYLYCNRSLRYIH